MLQKQTSLRDKNLDAITGQNAKESADLKGTDHLMADRAASDNESLQEK